MASGNAEDPCLGDDELDGHVVGLVRNDGDELVGVDERTDRPPSMGEGAVEVAGSASQPVVTGEFLQAGRGDTFSA